eukprot:758475-Hanusia_phi.AAC.3
MVTLPEVTTRSRDRNGRCVHKECTAAIGRTVTIIGGSVCAGASGGARRPSIPWHRPIPVPMITETIAGRSVRVPP